MLLFRLNNPAAISGTWVATHQSNLYWKTEDYFFYWMDVHRITSLRNCYLWKSHDTRSRLPHRLPIPCTNSMKRMFFYNAVKMWNNVSDNDLVCSSDAKKLKRNYFDSVQCVNSRLTVLKLTESFSFLNDLIFLVIYYITVLSFYS